MTAVPNVCHDSLEAFDYVRTLLSGLSTDQKERFERLITTMKKELNDSVQTMSLSAIKSFMKPHELNKSVNVAANIEPDIPHISFALYF